MRFLFSTNPQDGHFRPMLPLARALVAAGHEVVFATNRDWHAHVEAEGFAAQAAGPPHAEAAAHLAAFRDEIMALPIAERRPHLFTHLFAEYQAQRKLPELLASAREWSPHAIVWETCDLAGPLAAAVLGVPSVNHSFGTMVTLASLARGAEVIAPLWREHGQEPDEYAGAFRGLYVDLAPQSFAWEQPLGTVVQLRSVDALGEPLEWLSTLGRPLVYVTLGTVHNAPRLFRTLVDALDGVAALVTVGRNVDPDALAPVPRGVRVERFIPQARVLPGCDVVVSHGGSGTTLGALAHGLPLVLVPQGADQFDNAARSERAGAAVVVMPEELDAAAVRSAIDRVLSEPSFTDAARRVAAEIAAMPSPSEAAVAVEEHVAAG